jgi:hypothetical protein
MWVSVWVCVRASQWMNVLVSEGVLSVSEWVSVRACESVNECVSQWGSIVNQSVSVWVCSREWVLWVTGRASERVCDSKWTSVCVWVSEWVNEFVNIRFWCQASKQPKTDPLSEYSRLMRGLPLSNEGDFDDRLSVRYTGDQEIKSQQTHGQAAKWDRQQNIKTIVQPIIHLARHSVKHFPGTYDPFSIYNFYRISITW